MKESFIAKIGYELGKCLKNQYDATLVADHFGAAKAFYFLAIESGEDKQTADAALSEFETFLSETCGVSYKEMIELDAEPVFNEVYSSYKNKKCNSC